MTKEQLELIGLKEGATDQEITTALNALSAKAATAPAPAKETTTSPEKEELTKLKADRVKKLVAQAVLDKKITESEAETYTQLANDNYEATEKALGAMQGRVKLSQLLNGTHTNAGTPGTATKVEECEFYKLSKTDPSSLEKLQQSDPKHFEEIKEEYVRLLKSR